VGNRQQQFLWSGLLVLGALVGLLNDYPYPTPADFDIVGRLTRLALTAGIYGVLAAVDAWSNRRYLRQTLIFLPICIVVAAIVVDWCRWFVLASPIWAPLSLWGLKWNSQAEEGKAP
jgi:hypothetical protein